MNNPIESEGNKIETHKSKRNNNRKNSSTLRDKLKLELFGLRPRVVDVTRSITNARLMSAVLILIAFILSWKAWSTSELIKICSSPFCVCEDVRMSQQLMFRSRKKKGKAKFLRGIHSLRFVTIAFLINFYHCDFCDGAGGGKKHQRA